MEPLNKRTHDAMAQLGWEYDPEADVFTRDTFRLSFAEAREALDAAEHGEVWKVEETAAAA